MRCLIALLVLLAVAGPAGSRAWAQAPREVVVFAAASLTQALQEIADAHGAATGVRVKLSLAASSTLARQIESGAGAHLFVSADEAWMDYIAKRGLIETETRRVLLGNRLALVVPADKPLRLEIGPDRAWLSALPAGRIATGDPAHVPVGRYAEQALKALGAWADVAPRLVRADNVRNALVLVERGEAAAAIVYATDAKASRKSAQAGLFPKGSHAPITYPIALLKGHGQGAARAFYDHLTGDAARAAFVRHGFKVR